MRRWTSGLLTIAVGLFVAGAAAAVPISMNPNPVTVNSVLGSNFTLTYDGGDTIDNVLNFTVAGPGGCGILCPSTAVAAMVFDGVDVTSAGDTESGLFNANNIIHGIATPGGNLAALLLDFGSPNSEAFWAQLNGTPTTATVYALDLDDLGMVHDLDDILGSFIDAQRVEFSTPGQQVPEPSAAMVFAAGLLLARGAVRRRR